MKIRAVGEKRASAQGRIQDQGGVGGSQRIVVERLENGSSRRAETPV